MAKTLKRFKNEHSKKENNVIEPEILDSEDDEKNEVEKITNNVPSLANQSLKMLDQLEKAGYTAIASKLRELQITEGLEALDPAMMRLGKIEKRIDTILDQLLDSQNDDGETLDTKELQRVLNVAVSAYQARAKALLLPYGTVSPRTALQGNKGPTMAAQVNIGIGTGVTPRPKISKN